MSNFFIMHNGFLFINVFTFSQNKTNKKNLIFVQIDNLIKSKKNFNQALPLLNKLEETTSETLILAEINFRKLEISKLNNDLDESLKYGLTALNSFKKLNIKERIGDCYYELGLIYRLKQDNKKALDSFDNALKFSPNTKKAKIYISICNVYLDGKEYKIAMEYLIKADSLANRYKNNEDLMKIYNSIGYIHSMQKNNIEAIKYYNKSLQISEKLKSYSQIIVSNNNIGAIQVEENQYKKALNSLKKNEEIYKLINYNSKDYAELSYNIASVYNELNNPVKVNYYLGIVKDYVFKNPNSVFSYYLPIKYFDIYTKENKPDLALQELNKSLIAAKKLNNNTFVESCFEKLTKVYKERGDYKNALISQTNQLLYIKKIRLEEKNNDTKELQLKYDINYYQQNLYNQKQKIELLESKSIQSKYRYVILTLLILGLFAFIIRQNHTIKIKKRNENYLKEINTLKEEKYLSEFEFKNKQVTEFALQIQEQNNLLSDFKTNLNSIRKKVKDNSVENEINNLQMLINNSIDLNNEKVLLNKDVKNSQESFLYNLRKKFPELNEKEIQIVTYLRLNYNSKQIATQLNISENSIHNYRSFIRKKIGIQKDENLIDFLKNI